MRDWCSRAISRPYLYQHIQHSATLNITTTGDSNTFDFDIGETSDADSATVSFTIDGDNNIIDSDIDGTSVALTVTMDNSASLATTSTAGDEGNALNIDVDGNGDTDGHTVTLDITGGGSTTIYNKAESTTTL